MDYAKLLKWNHALNLLLCLKTYLHNLPTTSQWDGVISDVNFLFSKFLKVTSNYIFIFISRFPSHSMVCVATFHNYPYSFQNFDFQFRIEISLFNVWVTKKMNYKPISKTAHYRYLLSIGMGQ